MWGKKFSGVISFSKNENLTFWHSNQVLSTGKNTASCYLTNTWLNMFCFQEATERNLMYEQPLWLVVMVWWVKFLFFRRNFTSINFFSALKNRDFKTKQFKDERSFLKILVKYLIRREQLGHNIQVLIGNQSLVFLLTV